MKIIINNEICINTSDTLQEIAEKIRDNKIEINNNNIIYWRNVWIVLIKKDENKS